MKTAYIKTQVTLISKSQMKVMLNTLLDFKGIVHFYFTPQGQTVNQDYFIEIVKRLHEAVPTKRQEH
jgi:hypothetical protein